MYEFYTVNNATLEFMLSHYHKTIKYLSLNDCGTLYSGDALLRLVSACSNTLNYLYINGANQLSEDDVLAICCCAININTLDFRECIDICENTVLAIITAVPVVSIAYTSSTIDDEEFMSLLRNDVEKRNKLMTVNYYEIDTLLPQN